MYLTLLPALDFDHGMLGKGQVVEGRNYSVRPAVVPVPYATFSPIDILSDRCHERHRRLLTPTWCREHVRYDSTGVSLEFQV